MTNEEQAAWDRFAAAALQGVMASTSSRPNHKCPSGESFATYAAQAADAMIKERNSESVNRSLNFSASRSKALRTVPITTGSTGSNR